MGECKMDRINWECEYTQIHIMSLLVRMVGPHKQATLYWAKRVFNKLKAMERLTQRLTQLER